MFFRKYKSVLSSLNGINIYRGCTHGCIYCDSRSKCYQINHDFSNIEVKLDAPNLLHQELNKKRYPVMVGTGAMCDPYNHVEEDLKYTRKCLEVIYNHNCGIAIQTKSNLILRDLDLLKKINDSSKAVVQITLTTADDELCKLIEPNVCVTSERVKVLKECQKLGIPTVVWLCPFLPYINDTQENIESLLNYCLDAGVKGILYFGMGLTLREGSREYFYECLDKSFPGLKEKYIKEFGDSYEVYRPSQTKLDQTIIKFCHDHDIMIGNDEVFKYLREYPKKFDQTSLFDLV